jgi:hypothetical protein
VNIHRRVVDYKRQDQPGAGAGPSPTADVDVHEQSLADGFAAAQVLTDLLEVLPGDDPLAQAAQRSLSLECQQAAAAGLASRNRAVRVTAPIGSAAYGLLGPGGISFDEDGAAETDNPAVIAYCLAAGYLVESQEPASRADVPAPHTPSPKENLS